MSFFLSSPPQPTYHKSHQSHPQQSFLTPQAHRTSFFSDPVSWPSFQFQPKSPSPLRPSWNAGNVMRRQPYDTKGTGDDNQNTSDGELAGWENSRDANSSSFEVCTTTAQSASDTPQIPSHSATTITTLFAPQPQQSAQSELSQPRNPFTFQSHSQSTRPTTQLNSRIRNNRDTRRSLFLDRLRSSRRDERDNNIIEKFEKEEYWRDRRRREERMSREAEVQIDWEDEGVEGDEEDEEEMSPVDDEREVGELVEGWFEVQRQQAQSQGQKQNQIHRDLTGETSPENDFMDAQFDFEDSDLEEAFMQVLSQQEQGQEQQQLTDGSIARIADAGGLQQDTQGTSGGGDRDAEMS